MQIKLEQACQNYRRQAWKIGALSSQQALSSRPSLYGRLGTSTVVSSPPLQAADHGECGRMGREFADWGGWQKIAKDLLSNSALTGEGDEACPL